jgi:hypothetical protein
MADLAAIVDLSLQLPPLADAMPTRASTIIDLLRRHAPPALLTLPGLLLLSTGGSPRHGASSVAVAVVAGGENCRDTRCARGALCAAVGAQVWPRAGSTLMQRRASGASLTEKRPVRGGARQSDVCACLVSDPVRPGASRLQRARGVSTNEILLPMTSLFSKGETSAPQKPQIFGFRHM